MKNIISLLGLTLLFVATALGYLAVSEDTGNPDENNELIAGGEEVEVILTCDPALASKASKRNGELLGMTKNAERPVVIDEVKWGGAVRAKDLNSTETALKVEEASRWRLKTLTNDLFLSEEQQKRLFPYIAQSHPQYRSDFRVVYGDSLNGISFSEREFEDALSAVLTEDQLLDYISLEEEKNLWWREIINRLEKDLENSISLSRDHDVPPIPAPSERDPAVFSPPASIERGRNAFERRYEEP